IAQAIGRIGNYFNQELFGGPTTLPWGLEIEPYQSALAGDYPPGTLFHPTFLYEMIWNLAGAALIIILDRRLRLRFGRVFWLYVIVYTAGRLWIEMLRIDEAVHIYGVRINVWVSVGVLAVGGAMFFVIRRKHAGEMIDDAPARDWSGEPSTKAVASKK
ncbi:MAG: prolipoprotein diacylglyceryl transferase, partial [Demequinaceae bacterium]|nr:prolipoprotein diacylglyceryl transferase [Demequinaceae bacterium]